MGKVYEDLIEAEPPLRRLASHPDEKLARLASEALLLLHGMWLRRDSWILECARRQGLNESMMIRYCRKCKRFTALKVCSRCGKSTEEWKGHEQGQARREGDGDSEAG